MRAGEEILSHAPDQKRLDQNAQHKQHKVDRPPKRAAETARRFMEPQLVLATNRSTLGGRALMVLVKRCVIHTRRLPQDRWRMPPTKAMSISVIHVGQTFNVAD